MRWSTFAELVLEAKTKFLEQGYDLGLELHISEGDAYRVQRELDIATRVIDEALHPDPTAPDREGMRLFAVVHEVRVYVVEG